MSHKHFCDHAGHEWECEGKALRPLAGEPEPSVCICIDHQVPMEDGDHSHCTVELFACPEHRDERLRAMGYEPGTSNMPQPVDEASVFTDDAGNPIVGFCLWCDQDFYSFEELEAHNAIGGCSVFEEFKAKQSTPPVLQAMLEDAGELLGERVENESKEGEV
jgi:hypothetical protein